MGYTGFAGFEALLRKVRPGTEAGFRPRSVRLRAVRSAEISTNSSTKFLRPFDLHPVADESQACGASSAGELAGFTRISVTVPRRRARS
jgi:hypothetical protein